MSDDGGPAFPNGMRLRDWFAGQALVGLLSNPEFRQAPTALSSSRAYANAAYEAADAMLAERAKS